MGQSSTFRICGNANVLSNCIYFAYIFQTAGTIGKYVPHNNPIYINSISCNFLSVFNHRPIFL